MKNSATRVRNSSLFRGVLRHLKQVVILAAVYFVYMFVRKYLIADIEPIAFANAAKIASFEWARGFLWEPSWQAWMVENSKALIVFFNWVYIITFWPIILVTGIILYVLQRGTYFHYRNIVLLSFVIALAVFALFPLAPPRLLPEYGFIDTIQRFGPTQYGSRDMAVYYNAFAAMPSLHFGWTVLLGILFIRTLPTWLKLFGVIYPIMTFFAITTTGNHYIIDAVGGAVVIAASFLLYEGPQRLKNAYPMPFTHVKVYLGRASAQLYDSLLRFKIQTSAQVTLVTAYLQLRLQQLAADRRKKSFRVRLSALKAKQT